MHPHGHPNRYRYGGCRCTKCRAGNTAAMNRYRMKLVSGRHRPDVDAEPVRRHVQQLRKAGLGIRRIAELAGVSRELLTLLLYGRPSCGQAPSRKMRAANADKLLAVHAGLTPFHGLMPGIGTQRRLRALAAVGWPLRLIDTRAGFRGDQASRIVNAPDTYRVTVRTARAVAALYDELWNADPASAGVAPGQVAKLRAQAAAKGWLPPLAWDDLIDLVGDDLDQEVRRRVALMDHEELVRGHDARYKEQDRSPVMVEAAKEYKRRVRQRKEAAA